VILCCASRYMWHPRLFLILGILYLCSNAQSAAPTANLFANQPVRFEDRGAQGFLARGSNYVLSLRGTRYDLRLTNPQSDKSANIQTTLLGANQKAALEPAEPLAVRTNYFLGSDSRAWSKDIHNYARIRVVHAYPGIDLVFHGDAGALEYDFVVSPGADPRVIQFDVRGAENLRLDSLGSLVLTTSVGEIRWNQPVIYQQIGDERKQIAGRFELLGKQRVRFRVDHYDSSRALVIDPTLSYASYFGGTGNEVARAIGTDAAGNVYVAGVTSSAALPVTANAIQPIYGGQTSDEVTGDVFVAQFTPAGVLNYLTFLGGSRDDVALGIAVDGPGNAYVTGYTNSPNFPTTTGVLQTSFGGLGGNSCQPFGDAFVAKLNPSGTQLIYSTYLGGAMDDVGSAITIDLAGNAYVTGSTLSANFPTTSGVFQPKLAGTGGQVGKPWCNGLPWFNAGDAFVAKLNPAGSQLVFSTYLGGTFDDLASAIAIDSSMNVYVAGATISSDFPTTAGAFQTAYRGWDPQNMFYHTGDGFITKLSSDGTQAIYSTYLGGSGDDIVYSIVVDSSGTAYVAGSTSSLNFPVTSQAVRTQYQGYYSLPFLIEQLVGDGFVVHINASGTALLYSSFLGGANNDAAFALAVDPAGVIYVAGSTDSTNFPISQNAAQTTFHGDGGQEPYLLWGDGFFTVINPNSNQPVYSTYFGGSLDDRFFGMAMDPSGNIWLAGNTISTDLAVTSNAAQRAFGGSSSTYGPKGDAMLVQFSGLPASLEPKIAANGVLNGASYLPTIVSGSWSTVLGTNLASQQDTWTTSIVNGQLPTTLDQVTVSVGGQPAYISYIAPGQINFIAPNVASGPVQVIVTNAAGPSAPFTVNLSQYAPAFFPWPNSQVVATHLNYSLAAKNGTFSTATVPAKPGEAIILWGTGFGPTSPVAPAGFETPSDQTYYTSTQPTVTVNNLPAKVYGAALAPGFAGLYQVTIEVPTTLANGDWPVQASIGGVQSPNSLVLTVQE
jgi:uncharacterized protein (TIGR03437 family)